MKKSKKLCFLLSFALVCITVNAAADSYFTGSNRNLKCSWHTDYDVNGDYITVKLEGFGNQKKVYARMGSQGSFTDFVPSDRLKISISDYGPFGSIGAKNYEHRCEYK